MSADVLKKLRWKAQAPALATNVPAPLSPLVRAMGTVDTTASRTYAFALVFAVNSKDVERVVVSAAKRLADDGVFWVAYPKKTSKRYRSDLSRDEGWQPLGELGFEPVSQVAIDEDWSAVRFRRVAAIKTLKRKRALSAEGQARISTAAGTSTRRVAPAGRRGPGAKA